ncbi:MAG: peptide transporter [bacterium]
MMREDQEFKEFRDLMKAPDTFDDGFSASTVLMGLFVGLIMAPASVYMGLVAGLGMGSAAQWVTVLFYVEIARRAFKTLKRPEIFVLFYMCGAAMATGGEDWLWRQFIVNSEELRKMGMLQYIPSWYAPPVDPNVPVVRSFFTRAWMIPIAMGAFMMLLQRVDHFGLGYVMFRLTADVEELPFPMAPVGAAGMTALADASDDRETWRYRVFAMGAALGIAFGFIYLAIPSITGAMLAKPIRIIPIPFVDLTSYTQNILPAMPVMISFDIGSVIGGMVMPFWAMVGSLFGIIFTFVANPTLQAFGILDGWEPGLGAIDTIRSNQFDFYFSFGIGLMFAVAIIGFMHMRSTLKQKKKEMNEMGRTKINWRKLLEPPAGRGDIPIWAGIAIYMVSTTAYITAAYLLINKCSGPLLGDPFPLWILLIYGFIYTPIMSYISARMEGIVGQQVGIPYVKEATFILSGYKGAAIWFSPIPMHNYAGQVVGFRTMELTGTKFTSLIKAEILTYQLMIIGTLVFAQFLWSMGPVPSELYPYANEFWELGAYNQGLVYSATMPDAGTSPFRESFRPEYIGAGFGLSLSFYAILARFNLPVFLVYGLIQGLGQNVPTAIIPTLIGAFLGRFGCRRWFGDKWPQYRIVFAAGFGAGMGLITMLSLGFVFMTKRANVLPI